jgi:hypothetical protein
VCSFHGWVCAVVQCVVVELTVTSATSWQLDASWPPGVPTTSGTGSYARPSATLGPVPHPYLA